MYLSIVLLFLANRVIILDNRGLACSKFDVLIKFALILFVFRSCQSVNMVIFVVTRTKQPREDQDTTLDTSIFSGTLSLYAGLTC